MGATHQAPVHDITWSADGRLLAASMDGSSRVWQCLGSKVSSESAAELRLAGNASRIHVEPGEEENETEEVEKESNETVVWRLQ